MTNLAGILGMPIQAGPSGPAGGAAPPPGAFDALVAESVAVDATADSGTTGHDPDSAVPVLPPLDGEGAVAGVPMAGAGTALPGVVLPGVMLPGTGVRASNPLGMTDVPEADAAEGREDDAGEAESGWLLCVPEAPLPGLRDGPVTPAASGSETASPVSWRDVPVATRAWLTGSVAAARRSAVEADGAGASQDGASEEPLEPVADPIEEPDATAGARQAPTGGGLDPSRQAGFAPSPDLPVPPTAPPGVPPPAHTTSVPLEPAAPPEDTASAATDPRPHGVRASRTTTDAPTPGASAVQPGAGADAAAPAAQAASNAGHDAGKAGPRGIPVASAAPADRPALEVPEAGEPAARIFDVPPGPSGGSGDFSGDGSGHGQRDGQQAGAHPSHAVVAHAAAQSAVTFDPAPPAFAAAPADAEVVRLAGDVGEGVTQQIVQTLRTQLRGGVGEAVVRLKPEHLGEVTITVRVERGAVEATVTAALPAVREWLEAQEPLVRQHLADQGLSLTRLRVEPDGSSPDGGRGAERDREQPQRRRPRAHAEPSARFDVLV